jgi:hypothetical protein
VAGVLNEVRPGTAATNAVTVRNRTRRVGGRLLRGQAKPADTTRGTPSKTLVLGLDGGYVKSRQPWEHNFEITAGKLLGEDGECVRLAFATNEYEFSPCNFARNHAPSHYCVARRRGVAWLVVVAAEMIAGQDGLGFAVMDSRNGLRTDLLVVAMIVIGIVGVASDRVLVQLTRIPSVRWGYER